ncbi:hypothetical protein [Rhizobium ruizarguesonis]|uniref:hypothetical protein n=1 Tax=Rhizobium ruizarguesonis TaxID=2081791 RepID=UPI0013C03256|nr:hypothetical protein [Rhizobium ruizarguesonis]NEI97321.1 hypothetical protein [Rhizobium ruizarguesonis]NEJ37058.1 hypothetical protein [Rhizobium ruizarguesonis]
MFASASKFALWFVQQIGVVGVVFALTLAYYEGVPSLRDIPFAGKIPVVREFIVGRVELERAKAADAAREGYVTRSELAAAKAEAERYRLQAAQNAVFAAEAREQAATASSRLNQKLSEQEKANDEDTDTAVSRWRQYDLDRLLGKPAAQPPR